METPDEIYANLPEAELLQQLGDVEAELNELHRRRAALNVEETVTQDHREAIQRALGVFVLNDRRKDATQRG